MPEGLDALALAEMAATSPMPLIHVARDDKRLALISDALAIFAPTLTVLRFPAWDCLPYDRVSPNGEVASARIHALGQLALRQQGDFAPLIVLTTVNGIVQRVPPAETFREAIFRVETGQRLDQEGLTAFLAGNG